MNQPTPLKEKKSSSSRLSVTSSSLKHNFSSNELKRKGNSLTKKPIQIQDICSLKQKGKYLMGWGQVPSFHEDSSKIEIINKDIVDFSSGEDHLVFINNHRQTFAIGKNQFGQLGSLTNHHNADLIVPVFQGFGIKKVFCTHFSTFFITDENQLYACGLNNRGQLGINYLSQSQAKPQLINSFCSQEHHKKNSRSRISSVYYNELKKAEINSSSEAEQNRILEGNQTIKDIRGGPFHTVALTSKGRVFYSGNVYATTSLLQDQTLTSFSPINFQTSGKVQAIRSYLTGFGMLTVENRLCLLGHFGSHIYNEPYLLPCLNVSLFDINSKGIYLVDSFGEVIFFNPESVPLKGQRVSLNEKIRDLFCGFDYLLAISQESRVYGLGDNSQNQLCCNKFRSASEFIHLGINIKEERNIEFRCSNNFVLCLSCTPLSCESETPGESNLKWKEIQRENKVLKELLCNKNKKNVKIQTDKEGKFQFSKSLKPRTFDNSIEIPFEEIKLGKQISEGGYGIIYKATWRKSTVAVKLFKIDQENDNSIRDFISECHAMEALRHPNIVMFLGACTKPPHFAIVLQYCQGGTLWSYLQKNTQQIDWEERRRLALDVAKGMNYLHERNTPILHRDLKSLNLLLDQSRTVKLADFGWTKSLQNYMTGKIGTYQWMAPQVISAFQYTEKADIYSFGIILWEIASREAPYRNIPGPQVAQDVLAKNLRPPIPKKTPEKIIQLMKRCWQKDPSKRPSFSDIIVCLQGIKLS